MRRTLLLVLLVLAACAGPVVEDLAGEDPSFDGDRGPGPTATPPAGRHHPSGWAAAALHAPAALFVQEDCRGCHGMALDGGSAVSCDSCHPAGWRTSCTFCHGGTDNATGAPPVDITGLSQNLVFQTHTKHVQTTAIAAPATCAQCHSSTPANALDAGHWFDSTPGLAEVVFANGVSGAGTYDGAARQCSTLWCHGNGQGDDGSATDADGAKTCLSCHYGLGSTPTELGTMSGEHRRHINGQGEPCNECHSTVVNAQNAIANPVLHVNGSVENAFPSGLTYNGSTCNGLCHGKNHSNDGW